MINHNESNLHRPEIDTEPLDFTVQIFTDWTSRAFQETIVDDLRVSNAHVCSIYNTVLTFFTIGVNIQSSRAHKPCLSVQQHIVYVLVNAVTGEVTPDYIV